MKTPSPRYRCPLGSVQPKNMDAEKVKRDGWRQQGILVVASDDDRLDWVERELLQVIGERLYGEREQSHG
jgi:hypothetical protein